MSVYQALLQSTERQRAGYLVLIDPDKWSEEAIVHFVQQINDSGADAIMVGGSLNTRGNWDRKLVQIKESAHLPVVLFPGSLSQVSEHADALLFLSLISGRNPQSLIADQVHAAPLVKHIGIEPISTAYMLVESGKPTTAEFMSGTRPLPRSKPDIAVAHALAAEYLGFKLIYLEAGSGAELSVPLEMVKAVTSVTRVPVMVGGGIRTPEAAAEYVAAGARFVITGNVLESNQDPHLLSAFAQAVHRHV
ncbi:MAG: geranylgeranylglyceryl/heptaprenylglyceryl phosphate synthase [Candidatus Marinimicrobia bacterium]|nr:geranylgeranylglyceryl/heptaprenylglyceryl phosphate synthase [Candidatus Neomarinimicrobiota bacterium]MCF7840427.1 geranylgeranylglyceryl/heptaprenylglyceryl phosphate synthase [Candidatus Neomarinimicrobiota bacterium]